MLTIINPTPRKKTGTTTKRKGPKMATKRKRGMPAGLKKYWAKHRTAKRHRNPAPAKRRRRVHRNPVATTRRRTHRNPSQMFTSKGIFGELMTAEGLMMVGAVALTPTITTMAVNLIAPTQKDYARSAIKAVIGLGLGFGLYKFVNKKAGLVAAVVSVGTAAAECYSHYSKGTPIGGYDRMSANDGNLNGYVQTLGDMGEDLEMSDDLSDFMGDDLGFVREPGMVYV